MMDQNGFIPADGDSETLLANEESSQPESSPFRLEESLGYLLSQAARAIARDLQSRLHPYGLTPAQFCALTCLWEEDGLPSAVLAERAGFDAPTTTGILDRLERQELVRRCRGAADRRVVAVHLTERGSALREMLPRLARESGAAALQGLERAEVERLYDNLRRVIGNLAGGRTA